MRTARSLALASCLLPLLAWGCGAAQTPATTDPVAAPPTTAAPTVALQGLLPDEEAALDRSVSPCDDFFQFACGGWLKDHAIPDDEASWMRSFSAMRKNNEQALRDLLEGYAKSAPADQRYAKELGDFYGSCMDEDAIEKAGAAPLAADLARVNKAKNANDLVKLTAQLHARGVFPLFSINSQQDYGDSTKVVGVFDQDGLGLPNRDYYLQEGRFTELRAKYEQHVAAMLKLAGDKQPEASARAVLALETQLATAQMSKEDLREPHKLHNLVAKTKLGELAPEFPWSVYLGALPLGHAAEFNVSQPKYLKAVGELLRSKEVPLSSWRAYFTWQLTRSAAPLLSKAFVDENFAWQKTLAGVSSLPPRWKRCVRRVDQGMGEALAQPFVKQTLGAEGKAQAVAMVHALEAAMKDNLGALKWMDEATKKQAIGKLAAISNQIAYPDQFRSYDGLKVERGAFYQNMQRAAAFEQARALSKISKPVDKNEWFMTPPTVNAYYHPTLNQMVFPAGILQSPFFNTQAHAATNYGGIGMVMGHELTHGFDDEGRQFDAQGNLKDWWSEATNQEFERRASCVEKQFDDYEVLGEHVNGKLTLGENIADLGGIKLALQAYLHKSGAHQPSADAAEATGPQRVFLGYAQAWCGKYRDEAMRVLIATNPHSPPQLRVNGPLSNLPEFAEAFSCQAGQPMVRKNACVVW